MTQPWRILRSTTLLKDRWIDLRADHCAMPSGAGIGPYYVLAYPDWVQVVAVTPDGRLVLVRQYRHAVGEAVLELPGGAVDPADPSLEHAARRELAEETGYIASSWRAVASLYPNPATQTNRMHVFLASDAVPTQAQSLDAGEEGLATLTMPVGDVLAGLGDGLLGQAMHVAAVALALPAWGRPKPAA